MNQKHSQYRPLQVVASFFVTLLVASACTREPILHLHEEGHLPDIDADLPIVEIGLDVFWDYRLVYGDDYDWEKEWYYGWDDTDRDLFGELGYKEPKTFQLRRYFTDQVPRAPHTTVDEYYLEQPHFEDRFKWGFHDILVWNNVETLDGVQSLNFDETTSLDYVTAYTNPTSDTRVQYPSTRTHFMPEPLFAAYEQAIEIDKALTGFTYDPVRKVYVKKLDTMLYPLTYIYLTQIILHHNYGRVEGVDGVSNLWGMARSVKLNDGVSGSDPIRVNYGCRFKEHCDKEGEDVDIIGGRLMTFGMCNMNPNTITRVEDIKEADGTRHYLDVNMKFYNGMDSTIVFDVTQQVRRRYKGGVLTIELDMDTVRIPNRKGGSGFNAVVEDYIEEYHEILL